MNLRLAVGGRTLAHEIEKYNTKTMALEITTDKGIWAVGRQV